MKPLPVEGCVPRELLAKLEGKRVLITGCTSFVGSWMRETLKHSKVETLLAFTCGFGDLEHFQCRYGHQEFDYIIHCTLDGFGLEIVKTFLAPSGRMLYLSSGAVYGDTKFPCETDEPKPTTEYGCLKLAHEDACKKRAVICRLFSFVGPGLRRHIGKEFLEADPIRVKNDWAIRSWLYSGDMVWWLWTALLKGHVGRCYNVGATVHHTVVEIAKECGKVRGVKVKVEETEKEGTFYAPCVDRAINELGVRQRVWLREAIQRTVSWNQSPALDAANP